MDAMVAIGTLDAVAVMVAWSYMHATQYVGAMDAEGAVDKMDATAPGSIVNMLVSMHVRNLFWPQVRFLITFPQI